MIGDRYPVLRRSGRLQQGREVAVTDGLVLLAAWALFGALLAVLVWFILRGTR
jgi:hypothetical protein